MRKLDCLIVLLAGRKTENATLGLKLAALTGAPIAVMCSRGVEPSEMRSLAREIEKEMSQPINGIAIRIEAGVSSLPKETDTFPAALFGREGNTISEARNLGLLLGKALRKHVIFIDDDIALTAGMLVDVFQTLMRGAAVTGHLVAGYPDNSVFRHAIRHALDLCMPGTVGGPELAEAKGTLARTVRGRTHLQLTGSAGFGVNHSFIRHGFQPNSYNEDLIFLYLMRGHGTGVTRHGRAIQAPYMPFNVARAASEEFGDLLADSFRHRYWHDLRAIAELPWTQEIAQRMELYGSLKLVLESQLPNALVPEALAAINNGGRRRLESITPLECELFFRALDRDLVLWSDFVEVLPEFDRLTDAATHLNQDFCAL
jgi:hypothetical protein